MQESGAVLPTLTDGRVTLRQIEDADLDALAAVLAMPGVREWWGALGDAAEVREELRNGGAAFAIELDGELAGWLSVTEEHAPEYRHAALDIVLEPRHHGEGNGPAALRLAIAWLLGERGHHRVTIDPARDNHRAIRAYTAVGFRPVGVMRGYERGADGRWHDNLLMDLVAEDVPQESVRFTSLRPEGSDRFQSLRRELGVQSFGMNLITLQAGQRGRVHAHERQEEVYLVIEGVLTLLLPDGEHVLHRGDLVRVGPGDRRQLVNRGPERLVLLALGGAGVHEGRDGLAWTSWEDGGPPRTPREIPLPDDLPLDGAAG